MSSGIVLLIVVAVILVIVAYLVGILIRKRNDSRIAQLEERKQKLFDLPINEEIEEVKNLHLIGQSQTTFREWNQKWIDISTNSFADIENHIFEAENMNDNFHFFKASAEINNIESQLDLVEEDIKSIREALSSLKEQEEKNSARVKHALDLYEELQNSIEGNSDNFGSTLDEITKQLKNIESEFAEFVTLNSSGDPVEASSILDRAEEHTIANSSELVSLDLDRAEEKNADIQEKIDNLYSIFEREIASYKVVMRQKKILPDYLKHAKENNKKLQEELERLMLTYIFDETYEADVRSFTSDISSVETAVLPTLENFDNQVKPFSELEKIFEKSLNTLSAVENGQVEVFENLRDIEKNEAKARDELDVYIDKLHVIKRYMEKRNLPGIPESFLSVFFSTSAQIEALMDELSRGRINIDAVMRLTKTSKNAIEHLEETAYLVVQNATLTEQLLQYSNRYRSFEPAVQSSFEHALKLFEVDHDYDASLEEISYALETVEPGVTDRFVSSYEKTREQIRM